MAEHLSIILNIARKKDGLTLSDLGILRETIRIAVNYDPADQSYRLN